MRRKILVVGSNPFHRHTLVERLSFSGYDVSQTSRGREALDLLRRERPQLLILQYPMALARGSTLVNVMKADPSIAKTPILNLTPDDSEEARERAKEAGVDSYIPLPVTPARVLEEVRRLIGHAFED
jgi:CheY-like chemotaxis protein